MTALEEKRAHANIDNIIWWIKYGGQNEDSR